MAEKKTINILEIWDLSGDLFTRQCLYDGRLTRLGEIFENWLCQRKYFDFVSIQDGLPVFKLSRDAVIYRQEQKLIHMFERKIIDYWKMVTGWKIGYLIIGAAIAQGVTAVFKFVL